MTGELFESNKEKYTPADTLPVYNKQGWLQEDVVGVEQSPPSPTIVPPVMLKRLWSQSKAPSGVSVPEQTIVPPLMFSVPLESIASFLEL